MATRSITGVGEVERRDLAATGLRALLSTGALLAAYYLVPITTHHGHSRPVLFEFATMLRLGVAFALFVTVLAVEVRGIGRARHPMLRAGVALSVVIPLFLVFFAWIYLTMSNSNPATFHGAMDRTTALYFAVTIFSTVGFGDITPHTDVARIATAFQMLADLAVVAVVVRLILGVATRSTADRRATSVGDDTEP